MDTSRPSNKPIRFWIGEIVIFAIAVSVFLLILLNRSPNFLRPLGMNVRFGFTLAAPLIFIALHLAFAMKGWMGKLISLTATLALFALGLAGMWASGHTQSTVLNGLIPLTDAHNYFIDALRLLAGRDISEFSAARPLFAGFLATILGITDRSLMGALGILVAINALTCYLAAKEIQKTHGAFPAALLVTFLFLYYRHRTIGSAMSENLGLPLGILGIALIWRGITTKSMALVLFGIFVNTLALNARPGPFLLLPFLLLWGFWFFRDSDNKSPRLFLGLGVCAIAAGFGINLWLTRVIGSPSSVPFSQFSMALYGTASGGNSWAYVFEARPELVGVAEPGRTIAIYNLAFDLIRDEPSLFIKGALRNWSILFSNTAWGMFSYIGGENRVVNNLSQGSLYILCMLGLSRGLQKKDPYARFVIMAAIGVFLSAPFVPPSDSYGMRLYAAVIMIPGLLPALGSMVIVELLKARVLQNAASEPSDSNVIIWYGGILTIIVALGPLAAGGINRAQAPSITSCPPGTDAIAIIVDRGNSINIIREKELRLDWMPFFHQSLFKRNAHSLPDNYLAEWLETVNPPATLFVTLDYRSNNAAFVIIPTPSLQQPGYMTELCGAWIDDPKLTPYFIFISHDLKFGGDKP